MAFREAEVYKITSVADGTVLDLATSSTFNETDIITYKDSGSQNQKWVANREIGGGWCLRSLVQEEGSIKCIKQDMAIDKVVHSHCEGGFDQQWYLIPISYRGNICAIINSQTAWALTTHGDRDSNKVTCEVQLLTDPRQQWKIEAV